MKVSKIITLVAPLALALAAAPALAHGPGPGGACRQDVAKLCSQLTPAPAPGPGNCLKALCPKLTPGPGAFASCLLGLPSGVSDQCKQQLTEMQAKIAAWQTAFNTACVTTNDVSSFCGNVKTGPRGQIQCLRQAVKNNQKVSATCQAFLTEHHGDRHHGHPGHRETTGSSSNQ
jgi:hypothetical protein